MPVDHFGRKFSGAEPAASTRWVFLLLLSGPVICWLSLSGRWFRAWIASACMFGSTCEYRSRVPPQVRAIGEASVAGGPEMPLPGDGTVQQSTIDRAMRER